MKDITRIHIAKVPYSIELSAKKDLQKYIDALESYTADSELLQDIEIRMTELLLERGVKQEEVISSADVAAIREQLGEPKEFMTDDAAIEVEPIANEVPRKLYRDLDGAIIGGVLAGVAQYLKVRALWVRLAFIVLIFVSFGFFALLYVIAWLIVPAARTAAEKLQMTGRPVTLSSIRELNEAGSNANTERRTAAMKRVLTTILGIGAIVVALGSIAALVAIGVVLTHSGEVPQLAAYQIPVILMVVSGVLLVALSLLVAITAFAQKFNKRIWISALVIIVLGLSSCGAAVALGALQQRADYEAIQRNTIEVVEKLPDTFMTVKALSIDMPSYTNFNYVVDTSAPSLKQRMLKGSPQVKIVVENGVAKISLAESKERTYGAEPAVTIYGPAIENLVVTNGYVSYDAGVQSVLKIDAHNTAAIGLAESRIDTLDVTLDGAAQFTSNNASVTSVALQLAGHPDVNLGKIKALTVKSPDACAADTVATVHVQNILNATYEYNGVQTASRSIQDPCFEITTANDYTPMYNYQRMMR